MNRRDGRGVSSAQPPQVVQKTVKYREQQEHLLRRLGGALVLQWDALPDALQDLIIDQAAIVDDREDAPHEGGDIENFIRSARVTPLAKAGETAQ
jgi:hypothetical protein